MRKRGAPRAGDGRGVPEPAAPSSTAPSTGPSTGPASTGPASTGSPTVRSASARRAARDRRSRGLRGAPWTAGPGRATTSSGLTPGTYGPLAPPDSPLALTRSERFSYLVGDAVERLEARWERELDDVEFVVAAVPPAPDLASTDAAPLARVYPGGSGEPAWIVLYRRPIEARATTRQDLSALVHDVVVEQVAELLGLEPETVDPDYGRGE